MKNRLNKVLGGEKLEIKLQNQEFKIIELHPEIVANYRQNSLLFSIPTICKQTKEGIRVKNFLSQILNFEF